MKENIKRIILDYCKGMDNLEFNADDLDEMVERITKEKLKGEMEKLERYDMWADNPGCDCCSPSVHSDRNDISGKWVRFEDVEDMLSSKPSKLNK